MVEVELLLVEFVIGIVLVEMWRAAKNSMERAWAKWGVCIVSNRVRQAEQRQLEELEVKIVRLELSRDEMRELLAAALATSEQGLNAPIGHASNARRAEKDA